MERLQCRRQTSLVLGDLEMNVRTVNASWVCPNCRREWLSASGGECPLCYVSLVRNTFQPVLTIEHELGSALFKYIDRLEDQTEDDTAQKIVGELLEEIRPMLARHFNFKFPTHK